MQPHARIDLQPGRGVREATLSVNARRGEGGAWFRLTSQVVPVLISSMDGISTIRVYLPKDLRPPEQRLSVLKAIQACARALVVHSPRRSASAVPLRISPLTYQRHVWPTSWGTHTDAGSAASLPRRRADAGPDC